MNKEKKRLRQDASAGEYVAPEIRELEIKAGRIFCGSDQDITYGGYSKGEEEGY